MAGRGTPDDGIITRIMAKTYFQQSGPKSLDRMALYDLLEDSGIDRLPIEDRLATLCMLTARSIVDGIGRNTPELNAPHLKAMVICGGGGFNPVLMAMIRDQATGVAVTRMEDHGMDSGFIEAELMAYLAARSKAGMPLTFPQTTGVEAACTGGRITLPQPK